MGILGFIRKAFNKDSEQKCGGRGRCSKCGEFVNNVAYHEAWQCGKQETREHYDLESHGPPGGIVYFCCRHCGKQFDMPWRNASKWYVRAAPLPVIVGYKSKCPKCGKMVGDQHISLQFDLETLEPWSLEK